MSGGVYAEGCVWMKCCVVRAQFFCGGRVAVEKILAKKLAKIFWCKGLNAYLCTPIMSKKHQLGAVRRHFWPSADDGCDRIN